MELKHRDIWSGSHRGVSFEIVRWTQEGSPGLMRTHDVWNYYLMIPEGMVRESDRPSVFLPLGEPDDKGRRFWDYDKGALPGLDWHGGMTFYEVIDAHGLTPRHVKAGCDYNHLFDEQLGWPYTVESVAQDARQTIDDLHGRLSLRWRCQATGRWCDTEEEAKQSEEAWWEAYRAERAEQAEKGAA